MEIKKNPNHNLENYRVSFLGIGFILSLLFVYVVIEWKTYDKVLIDLGDADVEIEMEDIVVTKEEKEKEKPPPPPAAPKEIKIVDNDVELEVELDIESDDFDEDDEVSDIEEFEEDDVDIPLTLVEEKPIFPGCEKYKTKEEQFACMNKKILQHIRKSFNYPEIAKEMGIQGRVMVKFVINKRGKINKISVLRGIDKNLDREAVRIIETMKKKITFKPARQGSKSVNVSYVLPITFKLQ